MPKYIFGILVLFCSCGVTKMYIPFCEDRSILQTIETHYSPVFSGGDGTIQNPGFIRMLHSFNDDGSLKEVQQLNHDDSPNCRTEFTYNSKGLESSATYCPELLKSSLVKYTCSKGKLISDVKLTRFDHTTKQHTLETTYYFYENELLVSGESYVEEKVISSFEITYESQTTYTRINKDSLGDITSTIFTQMNENNDVVLLIEEDFVSGLIKKFEYRYEYNKFNHWISKEIKLGERVEFIPRLIVYKSD